MTDLERDLHFKFVPFVEQPTYPTWDEKLQNPRTHNILFEVDFSDISFEDLEGKSCNICHQSFTRIVQDFKKQWGDIEQLNCIVPKTPQIQCNCRLFTQFENDVAQRLIPIFNIIRLINRVINFEDEEDFATLRTSLKEDDFNKVKDFILNHWAPEGCITDLRRKARAITSKTNKKIDFRKIPTIIPIWRRN